MLQIANKVQIRQQGLANLLKEKDGLVRDPHSPVRLAPAGGVAAWTKPRLPHHEGRPAHAERQVAYHRTDPPSRRDHLFPVTYDEFTADVPLDRAFRFVVERLWGATRDGENRQILGELRQWLDEVTLLPSVTAGDASPALLTRLNRRLSRSSTLPAFSLTVGPCLAVRDLSAFAFVFDMNRVFEGFSVNFVV